MAEGDQNEQTPCVTVKMNAGKCSTDLNQLDLRSIAINSTQNYFFLWWAYSKMNDVHTGLEQESLNVTVEERAEEHSILSILKEVGYLVVEHAKRNLIVYLS